MKKFFLLLVLASNLFTSAQAFSKCDLLGCTDNFTDRPYLEDRPPFQDISIMTKEAPLSELEKSSDLSFKLWEKDRGSDLNQVADFFAKANAELTFNKIVGLSSGVIDVTYQVRRGVKQAIKETFGGYAEYQRRKLVEEVVNSTFVNHQRVAEVFVPQSQNNRRSGVLATGFSIIKDTFLGSSRTQSYKLINRIKEGPIFKQLKTMIKMIAIALLSILIVIKIFIAIKDGYNITETLTQPTIIIIIALALIVTGDLFFDINLLIASNLASAFQKLFHDSSFSLDLKPAEAWNDLSKYFGYFPILILSLFDMLSQIFVGLFYVGLIAFICFGIVFYPFWICFAIFSSSHTSALNSYIIWIKANFALIFSPILIILFKLISNELGDEYEFMSILAKTLSFYSTPLLMYFILFKAEPTSSSVQDKMV